MKRANRSSECGSSFARFQSLTKRILAVPKAEADKQKALAAKKQSRPKQSPARS